MKLLRQIVFAYSVVIFAAVSGFAVTLDEYKSELRTLRGQIEATILDLSLIEQGEGIDGDITDSIAEIRELIPERARIEHNDGSVGTDFGWVASMLDEVAEAKDIYAKNTALELLRDSIAAVELRIAELEAAEAAGKSKDENKQKLAEIMTRAEFQKPPEPEESLFARWWRQIREWLESLMPERSAPSGNRVGMQNFATVFQVILFAAIAALIAFLIYRFYPFLAERFGWLREEKRGKRVILGEQIDENISASDLLSEAERLAREGQLRLAVRKGYIALLCDLGDRRIISLARHKTNRDYLRDLTKRPSLQDAVTGATSNFERSWYGLGAVETSDWEAFRTEYARVLVELRA